MVWLVGVVVRANFLNRRGVLVKLFRPGLFSSARVTVPIRLDLHRGGTEAKLELFWTQAEARLLFMPELEDYLTV